MRIDWIQSKTLELSNNFYSHSSSTGKGWNSEITQEEMEMLIKKQRLGNPLREVMPSLEAINNANRTIGGGNFLYNHDAINRMLLIEFRAKKLGIFGKCRECHGEGSIYTGPWPTQPYLVAYTSKERRQQRGFDKAKYKKMNWKKFIIFCMKQICETK